MSPALAATTVGRALRERTAPMRTSEALRVLPVFLPVTALGAAAAGAAAYELTASPPSLATVLGALGLLAASIVAEAFPLPLEGVNVGSTSLATVFIVAAAVVYGWPIGVAVGLLAMLTVELVRRRPAVRVIYNSALYASAALAAGLAATSVDDGTLRGLVLAAFAAACSFYVVDIVLLAAVIARAGRQPYVRSMRTYLRSTAVPFLLMASLSATLVVLWDRSPFVAAVLIAPLLVIAFYERWLHGALVRLREFDRLKDEFIAVISHELRTPLASVYGSAVTLRQHDVDKPTRESLLAIIASESGRLTRLLDDVLWANRLDTGREEIELAPTDAVAIARDVVDVTRSRLPSGLRLELEVQEPVPHVAADADKLSQVLVNLIENAIKYSPAGGLVTVLVQPSGRHVRVSVRDRGVGIPPADRERIFEKFHRLERGPGGSGLGLYVCRELVERMHGEIWVRSAEGEGSTFAFELPQSGD